MRSIFYSKFKLFKMYIFNHTMFCHLNNHTICYLTLYIMTMYLTNVLTNFGSIMHIETNPNLKEVAIRKLHQLH